MSRRLGPDILAVPTGDQIGSQQQEMSLSIQARDELEGNNEIISGYFPDQYSPSGRKFSKVSRRVWREL